MLFIILRLTDKALTLHTVSKKCRNCHKSFLISFQMETRTNLSRSAKVNAIAGIYGEERVILPDGDLSDLSESDETDDEQNPESEASAESDNETAESTDQVDETSEDRTYRWRRHIQQIPITVPENDFDNHDIMTPLEYFYEFLNPAMFQEIAYQTNHYSVLRKGASINVSPDEIKKFIGISIYMGIIKFPQYRMYWSTEYRYPLVADVMGLTR